ncbi:MAG TPA: class I SAM-dependent methyltransferase [Kiloniellales bacterium]|jgi:SAM-dependent methyltransferase
MKLPWPAGLWRRWVGGDRRTSVLRAIPADAVCAEIGVWKGDFSDRIRTLARPRMLHLVDPWRFVAAYPQRWYGGASARDQSDMDRIYEDVVRRFAGDPRVAIHRLESAAAARHLADTDFDWVYVDGDHSFHAVLDDLENWASRIKPGGVLAGDDYSWRDEHGAQPVQRAVRAFIARKPPRDLTIAGDQFLMRL